MEKTFFQFSSSSVSKNFQIVSQLFKNKYFSSPPRKLLLQARNILTNKIINYLHVAIKREMISSVLSEARAHYLETLECLIVNKYHQFSDLVHH